MNVLRTRAIADRVLNLMLLGFVLAALLALACVLALMSRRRVFHFEVGPVSRNWVVTKRLQDEQLETGVRP